MQELNFRFLIQQLETLPFELTKTHEIYQVDLFLCKKVCTYFLPVDQCKQTLKKKKKKKKKSVPASVVREQKWEGGHAVRKV